VNLCSDCSAPIRPIVAVDIDGTLSEYHRKLTAFATDYWNKKIPSGIVWNGHGDFEDWLGLTREQYQEAKLAYRQGGYKRTAEWQPGAEEFMARLGLLNVEVWITTTRPWNRLDSVDPDTRFWLDRHGVHYDHLLYDDHKYKRLSEIVDPGRVIAVVEDLPDMTAEAVEVFGSNQVIQMQRDHNWPNEECWYLEDFSSAFKVVCMNLNKWMEGRWK